MLWFCVEGNPKSVNVCGSVSVPFPKPSLLYICCLPLWILREWEEKGEEERGGLYFFLSAQLELSNDTCVPSGCWGRGSYLFLVVICVCWSLLHLQNPIPLPGRENREAERQKTQASLVFLFLRVFVCLFLWGFFTANFFMYVWCSYSFC